MKIPVFYLPLLIAQYLQHALPALLLGIEPVFQLPVLVIAHDHMLGSRDEAMLDAAVSAQLVLVSTGMKESDIERFSAVELGKEDLVDMLFGCVEVMAVTGKTSQVHLLVLAVPFIDGEHQKLFSYAPGVRQGGDEGAVDHVPGFP